MSRTGKIARLSDSLRGALNHKIRDGHAGVDIVAWLNEQAETKEILARNFGGRPVSEQNLTNWKAGGYLEWERHMETREWVTDLVGESNGREGEAENGRARGSVADWLAAPLAVELARGLKQITADRGLSTTERLDAILAISRATAQLRRTDHSKERLTRQVYSRELDRDGAEEEKLRAEERSDQNNLLLQTGQDRATTREFRVNQAKSR